MAAPASPPMVAANNNDRLYSPDTSASTSHCPPPRRPSKSTSFARNVLMSRIDLPGLEKARLALNNGAEAPPRPASAQPSISTESAPAPRPLPSSDNAAPPHDGELKVPPARMAGNNSGAALTDTPLSSVPGSPRMPAMRMSSALSTPRMRPTTLDIPGLTKSKVSPDGKIAQRDVGSKLVIIMVGLPARGKSYITKKLARYLNWLQHDTHIFNVGERRRVAATGHGYRLSSSSQQRRPSSVARALNDHEHKEHELPHQLSSQLQEYADAAQSNSLEPLNLPPAAQNGNSESAVEDSASLPSVRVISPGPDPSNPGIGEPDENGDIDQSASFFDPTNKKAAQIREQCAMETLDELLDYILNGSGSVGIFDATNSTLARRKQIMERIRERAGPELNVLFVESVCQNQHLLETNMRLKLSGPDYEGHDPVAALEDFKKRVAIYEKNYVPLGDYEEENNMPYVKMIDVGRKMVSHQVRGFLAGQAVYYLLNFNLSPRMIWITRHGESEDNVSGRIGGDSSLSPKGRKYAKAMAKFIGEQRVDWEVRQADKMATSQFPPAAGDDTPPNPYYANNETKNFCVWTSMLQRSIQSAEFFCDEEYDVKQMKMLDELNAGFMEGLTYEDIKARYAEEFERRKQNKLAYRYPGPGGEGYLDIINRIRPVIVELERMTDHCLLITHRSVARVLLAYFQNLKREDVADLDCPLGMLYQLEPKPYGVEFKAWRYIEETDSFEHMPDYKLRRAPPVH